MNIIKPKAPRFYSERGGVVEACYTIPKADGKGSREPDIRDARKLRLVASVTSVIAEWAKPGLEAWKKTQLIGAALTLPRLPNETVDDFAKRIVADADAQSEKAREFGKRIHDAADHFLTSYQHPPDDLAPYLQAFMEWAKAEVPETYATELVVGSRATGAAGRLDVFCRTKAWGKTILDIKTQGVKDEPVFYLDWGVQLEAYRHGLMDMGHPDAKGSDIAIVSLVIDSSKTGPIWTEEWKNHAELWDAFQCCFKLWCMRNKYDPRS